jgi:hypothetical protein
MPNGTKTTPEFRVDCAMCGSTSFSATTNTLQELVDIVALHLRQDDHKDYLAKNAKARKYMAILEKHPNDPKTILSSPLFMWAIERLRPFTEIRRVAKTAPFPSLTPD